MPWVYLVIAGLLEVVWAIGLKQSHGFTRTLPSAIAIGGMLLSFGLLAQALKSLPVGTGYVVWTGIGAVGTTLLGMAMLGETRDVGRLTCVLLIVLGVVGLKLFSSH